MLVRTGGPSQYGMDMWVAVYIVAGLEEGLNGHGRFESLPVVVFVLLGAGPEEGLNMAVLSRSHQGGTGSA